MSSLLMGIQEHVAKYVGMISDIFDVQVDIADSELVRVAGTGRFNRMIGDPLNSGRVLSRSMETGSMVFVKDPENDPICQNCINQKACKNQCELSFPIKLDGKAIGAICIASSNPKEYETITNNSDKLILFMENITDLIALKVREYQAEKQQAYHMKLQETLINMIHDGVMILDKNNSILFINERCGKILGCSLSQINYLSKIKQFAVTEKNRSKNNTVEYQVKIRNKKYNLTGSLHNVEGAVKGETNKIFIFTNIKTLHENLAQNENNNIYNFDYIIGESAALTETVAACKSAAYSQSAILLSGESGTGKELFALAIHNESPRKNNQFIRLAHGASIDSIIEKAIFGRGSDSRGNAYVKNEILEGNTLYIREISDLSLGNQDTLLSVIQESKFKNSKIICSTTKNLKLLSQKGDFRQELFYALEMYEIQVPPVRARDNDVLLLSDRYLEMYNSLFNKEVFFSKEVKKMFLEYSWHGNIREIENVVSFIVEHAEAKTREITSENMPFLIKQRFTDDKKDIYNIENAEKDLILKALNDFGRGSRSKSQVARALGISTATLYRKLKQYGIRQNTLFE